MRNIEDFVDGTPKGYLKVRLFVYLNTIHKHSDRALEEIIEKACDVFGSDVTDYVVEWGMFISQMLKRNQVYAFMVTVKPYHV